MVAVAVGWVVAGITLTTAVVATERPACGAETQPDRILSKTRAKISFSIAAGQKPGDKHTHSIDRITRSGRSVKAPPNMKLAPSTGVFSWTPTESQVGTLEITFLTRDAAGKETRTTRRITVEAGQIAAGKSKVAVLLRKWYAAGTSAGNTGDFYDNRDGGHSKLNLKLFPQLDRIEYTAEQKRRKLHFGPQLRMMFNRITIGNSSTAAPADRGGSNTRRCTLSAGAIGVLYLQYRRSHLYVYPEHRDYDVGHNGRAGGYGDLFPANTPYAITSQGSSWSDRPFLEALAYTLAAFRPEVKRRLARAGLLMPTVQMIFRACNKGVQGEKAYLTGTAHRPVFGAGTIDVLRMVEMAHGMTADTVPAMIQLAVVEEDPAAAARDYFDAFSSEKLFDTPAAIACVARSTRHTRRIVVSAKGSYDINRRPLKYHWAVLQGDPGLVSIKPLDRDGSVVELQVRYHRRRPVCDGSRMESNRVDIGAFVHNGKYYSAPGFVSVYFLDNEARTYDSAGRILEVSYGHGDTRIGSHTYLANGGDIKDFCGLLDLIAGDGAELGARLLRKQFTGAELAAFRRAGGELRSARDEIRKAEVKQGAAKELTAARKAFSKILTRRREGLKASVLVRVEDALNAIKGDVNFYFKNAEAIGMMCKTCRDKRRSQAYLRASSDLRKLAALLTVDAKPKWTCPFPDGLEPGKGGLMGYHRNRIEQLNIAIMQSMVYPGLFEWRWRPNFVDPQIATPKAWRDVYRYTPDGRLIGWTRYRGDRKEHFTADGAIILKKDSLGRALIARRVQYVADRSAKQWSLKQQPGDATLHYEYAGDEDPVGRIVKTEKP